MDFLTFSSFRGFHTKIFRACGPNIPITTTFLSVGDRRFELRTSSLSGKVIIISVSTKKAVYQKAISKSPAPHIRLVFIRFYPLLSIKNQYFGSHLAPGGNTAGKVSIRQCV